MADINNCVFSGRLTRDAERKVIPTGTPLVTFDIACNTGFGQNAKVLYVTVNMWGKSGDNVFQYLLKGKGVAVTGKLEMQKWTSSHDGSNQAKLVLNCNELVFIGHKDDSGSVPRAQDSSGSAPRVQDVDARPLTDEEQKDIPF